MTLINLLSIVLTLGSTPDCDGFGICMLQEVTAERTEKCKQNATCITASLARDEQGLMLIVSEKKMPDQVFVKFFTTDHFTLPQDVILAEPIAKSLGYNAALTIPKGKYAITEQDGKIVVRFYI